MLTASGTPQLLATGFKLEVIKWQLNSLQIRDLGLSDRMPNNYYDHIITQYDTTNLVAVQTVQLSYLFLSM